MARKTNKEQVLTLAAELGVEVEYGQMGSEDAEPVGEPVVPVETVTTRHYVITDDDTDAEHTGSVIGNCDPVEAMRTMIGIVHGVSRETVRIWETDNYREYGFDAPHGRRGTARFLSVVETPLNPNS